MKRTMEEVVEAGTDAHSIQMRFGEVRRRTLELCEPLTAEDMMVQSCPEASPAKWHIAHTTWFFESFVLREYLPGYKLFHKDFPWLFNSYYQSFSAIPEKKLRASFSRPGLKEILAYREHVDAAMERLLEREADPEALKRIELGANHEEQHQELLLTDILNAFFTDPLRPKYREQGSKGAREQGSEGAREQGSEGAREQGNEGAREQGSEGAREQGNEGAREQGSEGARERGNEGTREQGSKGARERGSAEFRLFEGGLREVGAAGDGFCFDNELPRHRVWLEPYRLATRLVTCGEYADFMADGGYRRPELWLSAGWDAVKSQGWTAPLYWTKEGEGGEWNVFTLRGTMTLAELKYVPVSQVSFYEADAFARWAGRRLPTEFEWEAAAEGEPVEGNLLDSGLLMPAAAAAGTLVENENGTNYNENATKWYGDCWEWTASAYLGHPGFKSLEGTLGEYNGKFMSGQMVLRGGSCVTPKRHIRASYRNFFAPETRWQFSGIRLAS